MRQAKSDRNNMSQAEIIQRAAKGKVKKEKNYPNGTEVGMEK